MSTTYQAVIDAARIPLNDSAKIRYPDAEMMTYLNDGLQVLFAMRPDLFSVTQNVLCTAGFAKQTLPAGGVALVDIFSILNGRAITECDFKTLRTNRPTYRSDPAGPAQNWFRVPTDPTQQDTASFYIYPPAPVGQYLQIQFSLVPTVQPIANIGTNLPVTDNYAVPLQHYVTARAEMKDDENVNEQRQSLMLKMFSDLVMTAAKTEAIKP